MDLEDDPNCEEEFQISDYKASPEEALFDKVVGALQDIVISEAFENMQRAFIEKHAGIFQHAEENKPEYMVVFKKYQKEVESYLNNELAGNVKDFDLGQFLQILGSRHQQIDQQLLDMLTSLSEFEQFKALMVDYKNHYEEEERIKLLTIKTNKMPETKKVKGLNTIFSGGQGFQLEKSPQMMIEDLRKGPAKKPNKMKASLNIKQDETGQFQPDLLLSIKPLRKG